MIDQLPAEPVPGAYVVGNELVVLPAVGEPWHVSLDHFGDWLYIWSAYGGPGVMINPYVADLRTHESRLRAIEDILLIDNIVQLYVRASNKFLT